MNDLRNTSQHTKKRRIKTAFVILILLAIYVWAFSGINYSGIRDTAWPVTKAIFSGSLTRNGITSILRKGRICFVDCLKH